MSSFVTVARAGELQPGSARQVTVEGRWVALFNVDGVYHAVDNLCLHRGGPLCEGSIRGNVVTCPWHGWQFDVRTGKAVMNPNAGVGCLAAEIRGDEVYVDLG